ncbi:Adenylate cyclase [Cyanobacterium sp. HL-69]|uniref:CHAD domain-containing protein n=1 Tax=Cyanobacterium sp. HL-69 TaxID=2054282 RepID=UPI000CA35236|nr:Adenylate cyclase [Cyanobacterium sp. HL-69]
MDINTRSPQTFADYAYSAIALSTKKIIKNEKGVLADEDPEYVHQMRVGLRKLRSVLIGFSPALDLPKIVEEKSIGKIAQILGKKRDNDVLKENLLKYYYDFLNDSEKEICQQFIEKLEEKNKGCQKNIIKTLKGKEYIEIKVSLKQWLKKPQFNLVASVPIERVANHLISPQVSHLLLQSGWLVGTQINEKNQIIVKENYNLEEVDSLLLYHEEIIHNLRKEAKKTRYQMELLTNCYGQSYDDFLQLVVQAQEILGNIQDNTVLIGTIKKIIGKNWRKKLPSLNNLIINNQRQQWMNWQKIQRIFLLEMKTLNLHEIFSL